MSKPMKQLIRALIHSIARSQRVFPWETVAVVCAALSLMTLIELADSGGQRSAELVCVRLFTAAVLATPLLFTFTALVHLGRLSRRWRHVLSAAAAAGSIGITLALAPNADALERDSFVYPYLSLCLFALMVPFAAMGLCTAPSERASRFAGLLRRACEAFTSTALLGGAACTATGIVFAALAWLFDLEAMRLCAHLLTLLCAVFALGLLSQLLPEQGDQRPIPPIWQSLVRGIGAPFVAVMLTILVIYELYVVARGELPRNLLSPLIIGSASVGFVCALIIHAMLRPNPGFGAGRQDELLPSARLPWEQQWTIRLLRVFPVVLLALLPMAAWSLFLRIDQYGLTPARASRLTALFALAVLGVWGAVKLVRRREPLSFQVPACVAVAAALTAALAVPLSVRSQVARLDRLLGAAGIENRVVAAERPAKPSVVLARETFWQLANQFDDITAMGGGDALASVLTGALTVCHERWSGSICLYHLGVADQDAMPVKQRIATAGRALTVDTMAFMPISLLRSGTETWGAQELVLMDSDNALVLRQGSVVLARLPLGEIAASMNDQNEITRTTHVLTGQAGETLAWLVIRSITCAEEDSGACTPLDINGFWFRPAALAVP